MGTFRSYFIILVLFMLSVAGFENSFSTEPSIVVSMNPSPLPQSSFAPKADKNLDRKKILRAFEDAQKTEWKAFSFRQRVDLKELNASQKSRLKIWKLSETSARRKYFEDNSKSSDRRSFMMDSKKRYDAFLAILKDELDSRMRDWEVRGDALKQDQVSKALSFKEELNKGNRPSDSLWPTNGGY